MGVGPTCWGRSCAPYAPGHTDTGGRRKKRCREHPDIAAGKQQSAKKTNSIRKELVSNSSSSTTQPPHRRSHPYNPQNPVLQSTQTLKFFKNCGTENHSAGEWGQPAGGGAVPPMHRWTRGGTEKKRRGEHPDIAAGGDYRRRCR